MNDQSFWMHPILSPKHHGKAGVPEHRNGLYSSELCVWNKRDGSNKNHIFVIKAVTSLFEALPNNALNKMQFLILILCIV